MEQQNLIHGRTATPIAPACDHPAPLDSCALQAEYIDIARELEGDASSHEAGDAHLLTTNALYHGGPVQWSFVPKVSLAATWVILRGLLRPWGASWTR